MFLELSAEKSRAAGVIGMTGTFQNCPRYGHKSCNSPVARHVAQASKVGQTTLHYIITITAIMGRCPAR